MIVDSRALRALRRRRRGAAAIAPVPPGPVAGRRRRAAVRAAFLPAATRFALLRFPLLRPGAARRVFGAQLRLIDLAVLAFLHRAPLRPALRAMALRWAWFRLRVRAAFLAAWLRLRLVFLATGILSVGVARSKDSRARYGRRIAPEYSLSQRGVLWRFDEEI